MMRATLIAGALLGLAACMPANDKAKAVLDGDAPASAPAAPTSAPTGDVELNFQTAEVRQTVGPEGTREHASQGGVLVLVTYQVSNTGKVPISPASIPQLHLYDRAGTVYSSDAGRTLAYAQEPGARLDVKAWSDLNPGITTQGAEVFEISAADYEAGGWTVGWDGQSTRYPVLPK